MFTPKDISDYYDHTELHYRRYWRLDSIGAIHYGLWYKGTKNFREALANTDRTLISEAGIGAGDTVLDAGCGVGGSALAIAGAVGCRVHGVSLNEKQIRTAAERTRTEKLSDMAAFSVADYTATEFPDENFSVIYGVESVCHATEKEDFIREAFRLLKPGDRLVVIDYYKREGAFDQTEQRYMDRWLHRWAIKDIDTFPAFTGKMDDVGFTGIRTRDLTRELLPSAKRLYWSSIIGAPFSIMYNIYNPKVRRFARNHYQAGIYQYKALKAGLWRYRLVYGEKPAG